MSREPDVRLHADLAAFEQDGGLLDAQINNLHLDIGRRVTHRQPTALAHCAVQIIATVQRVHGGGLAYRVQDRPGAFGMPLRPENTVFVADDEPLWALEYRHGDQDAVVSDGIPVQMRGQLTVPEVNLAAARRLLAERALTLLSCTRSTTL